MNEKTELTGNMVGMHFRPPAKAVLEQLPAGTELWIKREPENPHDANAVAVLLPGFAKGEKFGDLHDGLKATGQWGEEMFTNPLHLGYVDSAKTGMARIFSEAIAEHPDSAGNPYLIGKLTFALDGKPQVTTDMVSFICGGGMGTDVLETEEEIEGLDEDDEENDE